MSATDVLLQASALARRPRPPARAARTSTLELRAGEALAVVGPNAAGKSTLVRALAGLLKAAAGEVRLAGRPLAEWPRDARARVARARHVARRRASTA